MYVIVGLGNPDKKYEHTRHNIGFDVIDALADKYNISVTDKKHKALCGSGVIEGMKVLLVKPQTYMNLSGESVAEVMNFYKLDPDEEMLFLMIFRLSRGVSVSAKRAALAVTMGLRASLQ